MPLHLTAPQRTVRVEPGASFDIELFITETAPVGKTGEFSVEDESLYEQLSSWRRPYKLSYVTSFDDDLKYANDESRAVYRTRPQQTEHGDIQRNLVSQTLESERNVFSETTQAVGRVDETTYKTQGYIMEERRITPNVNNVPEWYDGAPIHYHFQLDDDIAAGTYEITFLLSYGGKDDGDINEETVTVEVLDSVERNRTLLQYGTLITGLAAGGAAIASAQNVLLTGGVIAIATLLLLAYVRRSP